jgi:hypothetical protein
MRKLKKVILCLLVLLLPAAVFAGCKLSKSNAGKATEIITLRYNWYSVEGNILETKLILNTYSVSQTVVKGEGVIVSPSSFANAKDYSWEGKHFQFIGWPRQNERVYESISITANYEQVYYVYFYTGDDSGAYSNVSQKAYKNGEMPAFDGVPQFAKSGGAFSNDCEYTFVEWHKEITAVDNADQSYLAVYDVEIKSGITEIPANAFESKTNIRNVTIPSGVTHIGAKAFYSANIASIDADFTNVVSIGAQAFYDCTALSGTVNLSNAETIGNEAFYQCGNITGKLNLNKISSIGAQAFYKCNGITGLEIGGNLTAIGSNVFYYCTNLSYIKFNSISNLLTKFTSLIVPDYINDGGFDIVIGKDVTAIETGFFQGTYKINSIEFEEGSVCTAIGDYAFNNDTILSLTLPTTITKIGNRIFGKNTVSEVNLPNITELDMAFLYAESITSVILGNGITVIGASTFNGCKNLETVILPERLDEIGVYAFQDCKKLTGIDLSGYSNITKILSQTFYGCESLTEIKLPPNITQIGTDVFGVCYALEQFSIAAENENFTVYGGVLYNKTKTDIIAFPAAKTEYIIPNTITQIKERTFLHSALTEIVIPSTVTEIGDYAFANCFALTTVTFEGTSSLEKIGDSAFYYGGLTGIIIPDSVKTIGDYAFASGADFEYVIFSKNSKLESIGGNVFGSCPKLSIAVLPSSVKTMASNSYGTGSGEIFYCGTAQQLSKITISGYAGYWTKKTVLYFGTDWNYTDGIPTKIAK